MGRGVEEISLRKRHQKRCGRCQQVKSLDEFYTRNKKTGWKSHCKSCDRYYYAKKKYGVNLDDLEQHCEICGSIDCLAVDHDHDTGSVRGRLCHFCNRALGFFKDSPELVQKAAEYLKERKGKPL